VPHECTTPSITCCQQRCFWCQAVQSIMGATETRMASAARALRGKSPSGPVFFRFSFGVIRSRLALFFRPRWCIACHKNGMYHRKGTPGPITTQARRRKRSAHGSPTSRGSRSIRIPLPMPSRWQSVEGALSWAAAVRERGICLPGKKCVPLMRACSAISTVTSRRNALFQDSQTSGAGCPLHWRTHMERNQLPGNCFLVLVYLLALLALWLSN
jgi:hypothetical protein